MLLQSNLIIRLIKLQYDQISSNFLEMNSELNGTIYFSNKFADFYLFTWNTAQQPAYNVYTKIKIKNEIKYIFVNFGILFKFGFIDWFQYCFDSLWTKSLKIISNSLKLEHCAWQTHCSVQRAFFKNKKNCNIYWNAVDSAQTQLQSMRRR